MGQRISYYKNNFNVGLKELILENFPLFRKWYLGEDKCSMEEFGQPFGEERLSFYLNQNMSISEGFDLLDKQLIDELTSEFVGGFCEGTDQNGKLLEFFGPTVGKWRYDSSSEMVYATEDNEFKQLWDFVVKGRSLKDLGGFDSLTNEYKVGFLSRHEYLLLGSKIENHFGEIMSIKGKLTGNKGLGRPVEIVGGQKADSNLLSGDDDSKWLGLEYICDVLNRLSDENIELISGID